MDKAVELNIKGIKCDNPNCDFRDNTVEVTEYKEWLNRPCPKCGCNLLTKEDYENTIRIIELVRIFNEEAPAPQEGDEIVTVVAEMNGTGDVMFEILDRK